MSKQKKIEATWVEVETKIESPTPANGKSLQVEELEAEIKRKQAVIDEMKRPKGVPNLINTDGTIKRPDEVYRESLPSAVSKAKPEDLTQAEINAVERELRKFIARHGGFRKGLSAELKARCEQLMKVIGRTKLEWDFTIDIPGFGETHRSKK